MKIFKWMKYIGMRTMPRFESYEWDLLINTEDIEGITIKSTSSHRETYKKLRSLKTPQYDIYYLLRNKKGFNTIMFPQKYDVIITNGNNVVLDVLTEVSPGTISKHYETGYYIYFCPVGSINFYNIKDRDFFELRRRWLKK